MLFDRPRSGVIRAGNHEIGNRTAFQPRAYSIRRFCSTLSPVLIRSIWRSGLWLLFSASPITAFHRSMYGGLPYRDRRGKFGRCERRQSVDGQAAACCDCGLAPLITSHSMNATSPNVIGKE